MGMRQQKSAGFAAAAAPYRCVTLPEFQVLLVHPHSSNSIALGPVAPAA